MASPSLSRRRFLGLLGGATAAAGLAGAGAAFAGPGSSSTATGVLPRAKLGAQLWNCQGLDAVDGPETLALLAQIGYAYVEFAGFGFGSVTGADPASGRLGMSAKAFRKSLDDNGLWCLSGQGPAPYPYDDKTWKSWVHDNLVVGTKVLANNTGFPSRYAECKRYADAVHKAHDVARSMGYTGYLATHLDAPGSYWGTLLDRPGTYAYAAVLQHTSADAFNVQLDCGNAYTALGSVKAVIEQVRAHPGRWPLHHFKDCVPNVFLPDGSWLPPGGPAVTPAFGAGVWGLPDTADPDNRPHAGFQDLLTAIRETQDWSQVYVTTESNGSQATCVDYSLMAYRGLNGLTFPYRPRRR
jgi:sugar phosphate isomerase/epimerase